jgi:catechol 2,3-dioxygenase-like lactoylglutathione lyase family enzyme
MTKPNLFQITPFLRVPDIESALAFFIGTLGFKLGFRGGSYAYVWRDKVAFRMIEDQALPPRGGGRYTTYIDVEDVDGLWAELKPKLDLLPPGHVVPPCDQEYGQRDFAVIGPDGDLIAFGQSIETEAATP